MQVFERPIELLKGLAVEFKFLYSLASITGVPEIPNFLTLLNKYLNTHPIVKYLYSYESLFFSFLITCFLCLVFHFGSRKKQLIPSGLQNFLEMIVDGLRTVIVGILGPAGEQYVVFLGTLFIFVFSMNLIGMIPLMKAPSSSLNVTVALAITVFILVQYLNIKNMGFGGYLYHMAGSPKELASWLVVPIMFPVELLTQFARPVTLALRLFGNILGEKILIAFFALVGATSLYYFPIQTPFLFLGLLTSIMQALVFGILSTIYILLSVPHEEDSNNH